MYMNGFPTDPFTILGIPPLFGGLVIGILALWTIVWKGYGLWHAARDGEKWWFLAFLIINDLGILEIVYLVWFRKQRSNETPSLFSNPAASAESSVEGVQS